ncbi:MULTISPECIES: hypothetical protein [Klebsiella pneumoniae complex]|uniref:hypothetical protein n=1 Tax=Klebsiella pneumoniae complex TaxID=3390273 RepID=UPI00103395DE|nr:MULTISPECIES: hypothetical protein [Klebsiella]ELG9970893.1 hypothetical protein [Klebsiella michiganensis]UZS90384.1 hypothetical protein CTI66_26960 [Klebsiella pneumoniae]HBS5731704.1 hypothetical protein [Klebsiella pneumoniae]HBS6387720.1 hypothetical protein [Klebsiella pneumoniae]HCB2376216.1 hypothetical protein [Klebsiella pneumoniae]
MKHLILAAIIMIPFSLMAQEVSISATGIGVNEIDACQTAKSNLRLHTTGKVVAQGSCSCQKNDIHWMCGVDGLANEK